MSRISKKLADNPLFERIIKALKSGREDFVLIIVGKRRSGKSWLSIKIAEVVHEVMEYEPFTLKNNYFELEPFLKDVEERSDLEGRCVTIQELGVAASRRNYYKETNKAFNAILQTMGFRRMCVIVTVPSLKLIEDTPLLLSHAILETKGITKNNKTVCKVMEVSHNPITRKTYVPLMRFNEKGKIIPQLVRDMTFTPPKLGEAYNTDDHTFKQKLIAKTRVDFKRDELKTAFWDKRFIKKEVEKE
jgi:hypothetical protein